METKKIIINEDTFNISSYYNVDDNTDGCDVRIGTLYIGSVSGLTIPDWGDKQEVGRFKNEVENWLKENYYI